MNIYICIYYIYKDIIQYNVSKSNQICDLFPPHTIPKNAPRQPLAVATVS